LDIPPAADAVEDAMMRKILVPALVAALLATASIPVHAGGGHR
jgi:hypothetical protein